MLSIVASDSLHRDAILWLPSGAAFTTPPRRARLLGVFPLKSTPITAIAFAADTQSATQDLVALVSSNGTLLALERLHWKQVNGDELATRLAMLPDRVHLTLERSAAQHHATWQREGWTDYLSLESGHLTDAPPRPVMPGTRQAQLAAERAAIAATLQPARTITPTACRPFAEAPVVSIAKLFHQHNQSASTEPHKTTTLRSRSNYFDRLCIATFFAAMSPRVDAKTSRFAKQPEAFDQQGGACDPSADIFFA
eukprot:gene16193-16370_t